MANLVNLESVSVSFGVHPVLGGVSLGVAEGERIGVVGRNGSGKSTLLEVLSGLLAPAAGRVSAIRGLRTAVVTQRTALPPGASVRDVVLGPLQVQAEHEWAADPRIRSVLDGLGLASDVAPDLETPVSARSGGERQRIALAAALVPELDLLVLDEPTNHLDVHGVRWLAEHLLARRAAVVVVTHDRWFLDTVATRTWEVVDGGVEQYQGGYADWIFARAERDRMAAATEDRRRNLARKELAWLRRGAPARTSKPRYRIEAAETLIADVPAPRDSVELTSFAKRRLGRTVLELEDVTVRLGGRAVLDGVTWRLGPGDRLGLLGANGSGKTTLLRLLAGDRAPDSGRVVTGTTVALAHLSQDLAGLPEHLRVLEAVEDVARQVTLGRYELSASQLAERFGFPAARQWSRVAELSGGERRRLQLARLLMAEPNVLLLDEPTNDLDIDILQQLEDLLDSWAGTLVVASHDRYLTERVCDTVVGLLGDGWITHFPGGIDDYLARSERDVGAARPPERSERSERSEAAERREARKEANRLERALERLSARERQLHVALAEAATDAARLLALDGELRAAVAERTRLEDSWLEVSLRDS